MAGSPIVPDCVKWAEDGRVAIVTDSSIMISTFMSRELEMYLQHMPAVSKSFVFLPDSTDGENVPIPIPVFDQTVETAGSGSMAYFLLHDKERHQHNPKETSLSKNDGNAFVAVAWGPRGSGPNSSSALLALTSSSRLSLHFSSSFHMSWHQAEVVSERLFEFLDKHAFQIPTAKAALDADTKTSMSTSRKRPAPSSTISIAEYTRRCAMLSTLSIAWSPFLTAKAQPLTSLIALAGRSVTTIWSYAYPSFHSSTPVADTSYLSPHPTAWINTATYGWITTCTWRKLHPTCYANTDALQLVLGSTTGQVLLATVPTSTTSMQELSVDRVIIAPFHQPVVALSFGSRNTFANSTSNDLVVASGSTLSVWNMNKARPVPKIWRAHDGNITGIDTNYFSDVIFSCGVDGCLKVWKKDSGEQITFDHGNSTLGSSDVQTARYPLFGVCVSPNSAQVACVHIIPPAARPNRKSQADVSYSRVSCALEYIPSPYARDPAMFISTMIDILEQTESASSLVDVLWFCHEDNQAITSLQGSSDLTIPTLLNKLKGVSDSAVDDEEDARQPLYLSLCHELEERHEAKVRAGTVNDVPLLLQASYLLRRSIIPAEIHANTQKEALARIRRALYTYWAEKCLNELLATHSQVKDLVDMSTSERISALTMADYLSVQVPLSQSAELLVTSIYSRLGSDVNIERWSAFLQARKEVAEIVHLEGSEPPVMPVAPTPPPRQACFICQQPVLFNELDVCCAAGHAQERCFLSFQVLSAMDAWKCMGCGALASEIDFSRGVSPFYLLENHAKKMGLTGLPIACRLCGNYCSFFKY
ncbi:TPA: hypothetical protein N0F65_001317 [Lagenidium giganteum]|uniref:Transcription factor IIIC 90kDa subunit N-terminal domain-containing protein n=1 Tax=Lagenidium giganteum TaxID=4803 RepID=A0AAV2Z2K7_9STRA|nr:TPA: hypothetical protein N0F65_001317 [Lagenidium giganteum]